MNATRLLVRLPDDNNNSIIGAKVSISPSIPQTEVILLKWFKITGLVGSPKMLYLCIRGNSNLDLQDSKISRPSTDSNNGFPIPLPSVDQNGDSFFEFHAPEVIAGEQGGSILLESVNVKVLDQDFLPVSFTELYLFCVVINKI